MGIFYDLATEKNVQFLALVKFLLVTFRIINVRILLFESRENLILRHLGCEKIIFVTFKL